jgi:transposase
MMLSDAQWEMIGEHFPEENIPDGRAGRKAVSTRAVLEAVLWILNTGAQCGTCCLSVIPIIRPVIVDFSNGAEATCFVIF